MIYIYIYVFESTDKNAASSLFSRPSLNKLTHFGGGLACDFDFVYLIDLPVILLVLSINIK